MAANVLTRAVRLTGTNVPEPKRRILSAGPITAMFDNGALRYIRHGGREVLRGVAYLVRDRNWNTYAPVIEGLKIRQARDSFTVRYTATCRDETQAIRYAAIIEGRSDGEVRFSATATPLTDFLTNRTGFVVLHPLAGVAGEPVEILHTSGKRRKGRFPRLISPGQPIFDIRALTHTVAPGVTASVLMEGNKFEMEDHRNWMDASYKTYVCSLLDPWPYTVRKDTPFTQTITVTISGKPARRRAAAPDAAVSLEVGGVRGRIPQIGVGVPMLEAGHAVETPDLVARLRAAHLVCQIDGRLPGQRAAAAAFRELRAKSGARSTLEMILPAKAPARQEVAAIAAEMQAAAYVPDAIVITQAHDLTSFQPGTPRPWGPDYADMAAAVRQAFPGVAVGGGMLSYFTELNRKPLPRGLFDFVTHSVCPIVHAADDISVMETLQSIPSIAASVRAMTGRLPYHLGPSAIAARANPYGAAVAGNPDNARICLAGMDPRQRGLFAAAWNLGLVAGFAEEGLASIALGALTGPQGLIHRRADVAQPWYDDAKALVHPVYHLVAGLAPASGNRRLETVCGDPQGIAALAYRSATGRELWLANLTAAPRTVKVTGLPGAATIHCLAEANFRRLATDPDAFSRDGEQVRRLTAIALGPYGVARISSA
jgi:hypothetical protein